MITFGNLVFVVHERTLHLVFVHYDSIVVYFAQTVGLLQVVPRNFVVKRDVVSFAQARYPQINVQDSRIIMHIDDVVVEGEAVDDEHEDLRDEGEEQADEARILRLVIIVVQF